MDSLHQPLAEAATARAGIAATGGRHAQSAAYARAVADDERPESASSDATPDDELERTEAVWRPGMSRGTYGRLLRLLFEPSSGDFSEGEGGEPTE